MNRLTCAATVALLSLLATSHAHAAPYASYCDTGAPRKIGPLTMGVLINTFSYPNGSTAYNTIRIADGQWDSAQTWLWDPATWAADIYSTTYSFSDDQWTVNAVTPSALPPGKIGWTNLRWSGDSDCTYDEADILFANNQNFSNPDESGWGTHLDGATLAIHEWGHLVGLDHVEGWDIMRAASPWPYVAGSPVVGAPHYAPYPDDRARAANLYGVPANFKNLTATAQWLSGGAIVNTAFAGQVTACPGSTQTWNLAALNHGLQSLTFSHRVYLNNVAPDAGGYSGGVGGVTVFLWGNWSVGPRNIGFGTTTFPLPNMQRNKTYWTYDYVDNTPNHAEVDENDNIVHNARTFYAPSASCP